MKNNPGRAARITVLISLAFVLKTVSSCVQPVFDFDFDFNKITITNLDNTEVYVIRNDGENMYSAAVAFEVTLSDDELTASGSLINAGTAFPGFTPASAMSPEFRYHPRQQITSVSIVTLEEMSTVIPAGSDVTEFFVAYLPRHSESDFLYIRTDELVSMINRGYFPGEPKVSFQLFCKNDIPGSRARFVISVTLSDDSILTATTGMLNLVRAG